MQWTLFVVLLVYLHWIMPKGIDIFDEGIALLHANPSQVQIFQPIQPGPLLNLFVDYDQSTMMTYRQLRFFLLLACTLVFCISFYVAIMRLPGMGGIRAIYLPVIVPCLLAAGLVNYVNGPFALHYNHIVYCFIALIMSAALLDRSDTRVGTILWFLCGFLAVLLAYVKWPAAVAVVLLFLVYRISLGIKSLWIRIVSILLGFVSGYYTQLYLYELFIDKALPETREYLQFAKDRSASGLADSMSSLKGLASGEGYIVTILKNYIQDAGRLIEYLFAGKFALILLIGASLAYLSVKAPKLFSEKGSRSLIWFGMAVMIVILISEVPRHPYSLIHFGILTTAITIIAIRVITAQVRPVGFPAVEKIIPPLVFAAVIVLGVVYIVVTEVSPKHQYLAGGAAAALLFAILAIGYRKEIFLAISNLDYKITVITAALVLAPFAVAFGHDGGFVIHTIYGLTFWVAAIAVITYFYDVSGNKDGVVSRRLVTVSITTAFLTSIIILQVLFNSMFKPYHTPTQLWQQDQLINNTEKLSGIELDSVNKDFFDNLSEFINKEALHDKRPILAVGSYPGWVFALSSFSPVHLWYTNNMKLGFGYHNLKGDMCQNLIDSISFYGLPSLLVPTSLVSPSTVPACLSKLGFPEKFKSGLDVEWFDYRTNKIIDVRYYIPVE